MPRALLIIAFVGGCVTENPFHGAVDLSRRDGGVDLALPEFDFSVELPDFSVEPNDLAGRDLARPDLSTPDLVQVDLAQVLTTIHLIDTDQIPDGTHVVVSGVVLTGIARFTDISSAGRCIYEAFGQDSSAAPSGIRLITTGVLCTPVGVSCSCPFPPSTGTPIDNALTLGTIFTVDGVVDVFMPPSGPTIHEIQLISLTSTGSGSVTAIDFTSGTNFALNGSGYTTHESMLVRIIPASPFIISTVGSKGEFTGAGAQFAGLYRFVYGAGNTFPASSSTWSSITGIAQPGFGGGIAPRTQGDFVQ